MLSYYILRAQLLPEVHNQLDVRLHLLHCQFALMLVFFTWSLVNHPPQNIFPNKKTFNVDETGRDSAQS